MAELTHHQLDHDGIVEEAQSRDVIGNQVLGLAEIRERVQDAATLHRGQIPLRVLQHLQEQLQATQPVRHEARQRDVADALQEFPGLLDHALGREVAGAFEHPLHDPPEMLQVRVSEFERHDHGKRPWDTTSNMRLPVPAGQSRWRSRTMSTPPSVTAAPSSMRSVRLSSSRSTPKTTANTVASRVSGATRDMG